MEPIENQQEDGKKGEKLAKKSEPRRRRLIQDIEKLYSETRKIVNETCRQTVHFIDILYTLDSASNYSAIQKLKPRLQTQDIPMK
jgi:hypothetical protein